MLYSKGEIREKVDKKIKVNIFITTRSYKN